MQKPARKKRQRRDGGELLKQILGTEEGDRRIVILRALWHLMLEKGYASTSLTDIAKRARMKASHVAYYFANKEAILIELDRALIDAIVSNLAAHKDESPAE